MTLSNLPDIGKLRAVEPSPIILGSVKRVPSNVVKLTVRYSNTFDLDDRKNAEDAAEELEYTIMNRYHALALITGGLAALAMPLCHGCDSITQHQ